MSGRQTDWAAQDWDDLVPRLLLLAVSRLYRMTWRGRRGEAPPGAAEAEDYVNDAISKTISGVRVWNPGNCTLFQHLAGVVVSDISHAAESMENRTTVAPPHNPGEDRWPPDPADDAPDPERAAEWRSERERLVGWLEASDPDLAAMAELMLTREAMAELMLPRDMQDTDSLRRELGAPGPETANRRKRLKRAVRAYMAEQGA
jgi:hypothetical protein